MWSWGRGKIGRRIVKQPAKGKRRLLTKLQVVEQNRQIDDSSSSTGLVVSIIRRGMRDAGYSAQPKADVHPSPHTSIACFASRST